MHWSGRSSSKKILLLKFNEMFRSTCKNHFFQSSTPMWMRVKLQKDIFLRIAWNFQICRQVMFTKVHPLGVAKNFELSEMSRCAQRSSFPILHPHGWWFKQQKMFPTRNWMKCPDMCRKSYLPTFQLHRAGDSKSSCKKKKKKKEFSGNCVTCSDLHTYMSSFPILHGGGGLEKITFLRKSRHFMQFLAKDIFCNLTSTAQGTHCKHTTSV